MRINDVIYGEIEITDPCAIALIEHPSFARLWNVNQNGAQIFVNPEWKSSRAEHCIGVYHVLRLHGASREEQIAGLLHDANHPAFSHVIDYVFNDTVTQEAHQSAFDKNIHLDALGDVVEAHGFSRDRVLDYESFSLLEQPSGLCADRIDYTFRDGLNTKQTTQNEILTAFLPHIKNHDGRFVMDDINVADRFSRLSMDNDTVRAGHRGVALFFGLAACVRRALELGAIAKADLLTDDAEVLAKLRAMDDDVIRGFFAWTAAGAPIELGSAEHHDAMAHEKFRWIDPLVLIEGELKLATNLRPGLQKLVESLTYLKLAPRYVRLPAPHDQFLKSAS